MKVEDEVEAMAFKMLNCEGIKLLTPLFTTVINIIKIL